MKIELKPVSGLEDAKQFLKGLETETSRKILVAALKKAAQPVIKAGRAEAPVAGRKVVEFWGKRRVVNPGVLRKSIRAVVPKRKNERMAEVYIGPLKKRKGKTTKAEMENKNDAWYRHFVIRGTAGFTIKKGKNKGRFMPGQAANPFMDRAVASSGSATTSALEKSLTDSINSYIKRKRR